MRVHCLPIEGIFVGCFMSINLYELNRVIQQFEEDILQPEWLMNSFVSLRNIQRNPGVGIVFQ